RRCANATPASASTQLPSSSGPRSTSLEPMPRTISSHSSESRLLASSTNPAIPHISQLFEVPTSGDLCTNSIASVPIELKIAITGDGCTAMLTSDIPATQSDATPPQAVQCLRHSHQYPRETSAAARPPIDCDGNKPSTPQLALDGNNASAVAPR